MVYFTVLFWGVVTAHMVWNWPSVRALPLRPHRLAVLAAVLLATAIVLVGVSSYLSCWCCIDYSIIQDMCDTTLTVTRLLEQRSIPYWICFGTLLGAVREKDMPYQIMPWEHDMDICIMEHDFPKVQAVVEGLKDQDIYVTADGVLYHNTWRNYFSRSFTDIYQLRNSTTKPGDLHSDTFFAFFCLRGGHFVQNIAFRIYPIAGMWTVLLFFPLPYVCGREGGGHNR